MNKHQTAVAAEAFAAGVFAHAGYSVFVQYGANQPGYDLVICDDKDDGHTMRVNVKGSTNGGWLLANKNKDGTWEKALEEWSVHNQSFAFCLVQFQEVDVGKLPNIYLATGAEIGAELRSHWFGELSLSLWVEYSPKKGKHKGKTLRIPENWLMTEERIMSLMSQHGERCRSLLPASTGEPELEPFSDAEQDYLLREAGSRAEWDDPAMNVYNDLDPRKES
jgi:hypothetical protein